MKALFVEYTIVEVKEKNIKILMPNRALIGEEQNNVMTVGEEKIEHISRTKYENGKKCYVESLPYEDIKKQIGENGEITDVCTNISADKIVVLLLLIASDILSISCLCCSPLLLMYQKQTPQQTIGNPIVLTMVIISCTFMPKPPFIYI